MVTHSGCSLVNALNYEAKSFEKREIVRMSGLRIFIDAVGSDVLSRGTVFYSRRADGPYYRWRYEERLARWSGSRMHSELMPKELCLATWKGVPASLKASLNEHYLE